MVAVVDFFQIDLVDDSSVKNFVPLCFTKVGTDMNSYIAYLILDIIKV